MADYNKGKIYKIISNQTTDVYFGSTVKPLSRRMTGHRSGYKRCNENMGHYVSSYEILKYSDAKIILVELFPCNSIQELKMREQYYIDNNECVNKFKAHITEEQRKDENLLRCEKFKINNKEHLFTYRQKYRKDNKIIIQNYLNNYTQNHKEEKRLYDKKLRDDNNKKYYCEYCCKEFLNRNLPIHLKTYKHIINFINY